MKELQAIDIAKMFHDIYERLAPQFGYETREDTREFDPESANGKLMIATIDELMPILIDEMESNLFLKDIVAKTRIDTLRQVLPKQEHINDGDWNFINGYSTRGRDIEDKAKELWGIDLTNLN